MRIYRITYRCYLNGSGSYQSGSDRELPEPSTKVVQASDSRAAVDKVRKNVAACEVSSIEFVCRVDI